MSSKRNKKVKSRHKKTITKKAKNTNIVEKVLNSENIDFSKLNNLGFKERFCLTIAFSYWNKTISSQLLLLSLERFIRASTRFSNCTASSDLNFEQLYEDFKINRPCNDEVNVEKEPKHVLWRGQKMLYFGNQNIAGLQSMFFVQPLLNDDFIFQLMKVNSDFLKDMPINDPKEIFDYSMKNFGLLEFTRTTFGVREFYEFETKRFFLPTPYFFAAIFESYRSSHAKEYYMNIFVQNNLEVEWIKPERDGTFRMLPRDKIFVSDLLMKIYGSSLLPACEVLSFLLTKGQNNLQKLLNDIRNNSKKIDRLSSSECSLYALWDFFHNQDGHGILIKQQSFPIFPSGWEFSNGFFKEFYEKIGEVEEQFDIVVNPNQFVWSDDACVMPLGVCFQEINKHLWMRFPSSKDFFEIEHIMTFVQTASGFYRQFPNASYVPTTIHLSNKILVIQTREKKMEVSFTRDGASIKQNEENFLLQITNGDFLRFKKTYKSTNIVRKVELPSSLNLSEKDFFLQRDLWKKFTEIFLSKWRTFSSAQKRLPFVQSYELTNKMLHEDLAILSHLELFCLDQAIKDLSLSSALAFESSIQQQEQIFQSKEIDNFEKNKGISFFNDERGIARMTMLSLNKINFFVNSIKKSSDNKRDSLLEIVKVIVDFTIHISHRTFLLSTYRADKDGFMHKHLVDDEDFFDRFQTNAKDLIITSSSRKKILSKDDIAKIFEEFSVMTEMLINLWKSEPLSFLDSSQQSYEDEKELFNFILEKNGFNLPSPITKNGLDSSSLNTNQFTMNLMILMSEVKNSMQISSLMAQKFNDIYLKIHSSAFEKMVNQLLCAKTKMPFILNKKIESNDKSMQREFDCIFIDNKFVISIECLCFMNARGMYDISKRFGRINKKLEQTKAQKEFLEKMYPDKKVVIFIISSKKVPNSNIFCFDEIGKLISEIKLVTSYKTK